MVVVVDVVGAPLRRIRLTYKSYERAGRADGSAAQVVPPQAFGATMGLRFRVAWRALVGFRLRAFMFTGAPPTFSVAIG